jgi:DNA-binding MarR family transcriptional regulator
MSSRANERARILRVCAAAPASADMIAQRLGRNPSATRALLHRMTKAGLLVRLPHPSRQNGSIYGLGAVGQTMLTRTPVTIDGGESIVLIRDQLDQDAAHALRDYVQAQPPAWLLRVYGSYRLLIAYEDERLADGLELRVNHAAGGATAAAVLRAGGQRLPLDLGI